MVSPRTSFPDFVRDPNRSAGRSFRLLTAFFWLLCSVSQFSFCTDILLLWQPCLLVCFVWCRAKEAPSKGLSGLYRRVHILDGASGCQVGTDRPQNAEGHNRIRNRIRGELVQPGELRLKRPDRSRLQVTQQPHALDKNGSDEDDRQE